MAPFVGKMAERIIGLLSQTKMDFLSQSAQKESASSSALYIL